MSASKPHRDEVSQLALAQEMLSDALDAVKREQTQNREDVAANRKATDNNKVAIDNLTHTVERVLIILAGDDVISKEPGLIKRVGTLEKNEMSDLLVKAKLVGVWVGAATIVALVYKGASLLLNFAK